MDGKRDDLLLLPHNSDPRGEGVAAASTYVVAMLTKTLLPPPTHPSCVLLATILR